VANYLAKREPKLGTPEFGKAFEHFILMELMAYQAYRQAEMEIRFWRTSTYLEVDFLINDRVLALEVKGSSRVHETDLKALRALIQDGPVRRRIVVCLEKEPRQLEPNIEILPWRNFLDQLWADTLI